MHNPNEQADRAAIEKRAYQIYLERGATDGNDMEDWLTAEKEMSMEGPRFDSAKPDNPRTRAAVAAETVTPRDRQR